MPVAFSLSNVNFSYRRSTRPALRGINIEIPIGGISALAGRTGAGKTTLARTINGLVPYFLGGDFSGQAELFGRPLVRENRHEAIRRVGMLFQDFEAQLFSTSVRAEVAFPLECRGIAPPEMAARVEQALIAVGLQKLKDREPSTLSGGQKQRLALACLFALDPEVLVLDEPTTDLDPAAKNEIAALLKGLATRQRTVVLIEHETDLLLEADRLFLMADGGIVGSGNTSAMFKDLDALSDCGVRPPAFGLLWRRLGLSGPPDTLEEALARLKQERFFASPPAQIRLAAGQKPLFTIEELCFSYPKGPEVLQGINLEIMEGEALAILGPNGSGKTTLVQHLNGLHQPKSGRVIFEGQDLSRKSVGLSGTQIGYVFQNPDHQIFCPTVFEEVAFGLKIRGIPRSKWKTPVAEALIKVGLAGAEPFDPFLMTKGERQKLALASVLVTEPKVLILDEPTTGLDALEQEAMAHLFRELTRQGQTLIIITHSMDTALACAERAVLLKEGRIFADGPIRGIFAQPELLSQTQLCAPLIAQLSSKLGLGALDMESLIRGLRRRPA